MQYLILLVLILASTVESSAQQTYAEGITGPWNDGYKCQITRRDSEFAKAYKYKRVRDSFAPDCFFSPSLNWTTEEEQLYRVLSKRKNQPCFPAFTKRMLDGGSCYLSLHPDPNIRKVGLQSTNDFTLIVEPEGLSPKWSGVFWSLTQKQYRRFWIRFQHRTYLSDKEEEDAAKAVLEFVDEPTAIKVNNEDVVDRRSSERQKAIENRVEIHAKVLKFFQGKPYNPGKPIQPIPMVRRGKDDGFSLRN